MKWSALIVGVVFFFSASAFAAEDAGTGIQCGELVKECFGNSGLKRANCFYSTASHPFCEGTEVGKLVYKRWTLAANSTVDGKTPPGLLGPAIYDDGCISRIDNQWLSELVQNKVNDTVAARISVQFEQCKIEENLEVIRP